MTSASDTTTDSVNASPMSADAMSERWAASKRNQVQKPRKHKNETVYSVALALLILGTYLTLATIAATLTMDMERKKDGFKTIKVSRPISFIDHTYMDDDKKDNEK